MGLGVGLGLRLGLGLGLGLGLVWLHVFTCASSLPTESWRTLRVVLSTVGGMGSVLATTTW